MFGTGNISYCFFKRSACICLLSKPHIHMRVTYTYLCNNLSISEICVYDGESNLNDFLANWNIVGIIDSPGVSTIECLLGWFASLQWRHNEGDGVWNHKPHDCLPNRLFKAKIKENIKALRYWPFLGEFTGHRWIPRSKGQWRGKCFHLMTSSCNVTTTVCNVSLFESYPTAMYIMETTMLLLT